MGGRTQAVVLGMTVVGCLFLLALPVRGYGATVKVVNLDGPGEGFNDLTPAAPVGGNAETTVGGQRRQAFQFAADMWGERLESALEIRVGAEFNPLPCHASAAVLGSAGPNSLVRDFDHAPVAGAWFVQALANSLLGADTDPGEDDVGAEFNSRVGAPDCLSGSSWYLGLDGNPPPGTIDFVTIALHELAHGLGFLDLVNLKTGAKFLGLDDAFMRFLQDPQSEKLYPDMTDPERVDASARVDGLLWSGEHVTVAGEALVSGKDPETGQVKLYTPEDQDLGSSVSHFSDELSPHELMEPFYTGPNHNVELTVALFADLGWQVLDAHVCGNGALDPGEACDDENVIDGDGCDRSCRIETCFTCEGEPSTCLLQPSCGLTLDHFDCHPAQVAKGAPLFSPRKIKIADEAASTEVTIVKPTNLCAPANVNTAGFLDPTAHLTCYQVRGSIGQESSERPRLRIANRFGGDQQLTLGRLQSLCLPSQVDDIPSRLQLDAYACYQAQTTRKNASVKRKSIDLVDSLESQTVTINKPVTVCAPLDTGAGAVDPDAYLTCYQAKQPPGVGTAGSRTLAVANQFGARQMLAATNPGILCAPSRKMTP